VSDECDVESNDEGEDDEILLSSSDSAAERDDDGDVEPMVEVKREVTSESCDEVLADVDNKPANADDTSNAIDIDIARIIIKDEKDDEVDNDEHVSPGSYLECFSP